LPVDAAHRRAVADAAHAHPEDKLFDEVAGCQRDGSTKPCAVHVSQLGNVDTYLRADA